MKKNNFILIFLIIFVFNIFASDGDLDTTFNPSGPLPGTNTNNFPPNTVNTANGIALMNDGSLILAGSTGLLSNFAIAKYTSTGILDSSFGGGDGLVTTIFPGPNLSQANDVQITADSKIIAIGSTLSIARFALAKYASNGGLDTSFGGGTGLVTTQIVTGSSTDAANAGVILSDGKIIAVGRSAVLGATFLALAKYNTDGTLDEGFTNSSSVGSPVLGTIRLNIFGGTTSSQGLDVITQNVDGVERILVVGAGPDSYFLARFNLDGSFDTSFGTNGIVIDKFDNTVGAVSIANSVAIDESNRIIVAGSTTLGGTTLGGFARYFSFGTLTPSFGINGKITTDAINNVSSIQVVPNIQNIIAVGFIGTLFSPTFGIIRLTVNGFLDSTFADTGVREITFPGFTSGLATDVVIQPDLKIVAGGIAFNGFFNPQNFAIARLLGKTSTFVNILEPSQNEVIKTNNVNFRIQTDPRNSVRLEVDSIVRTGEADIDGFFSITVILSNGSYNARVTVEDAAGNTASASVNFSVSTGTNCTLPADQLTLAIREKYGS